MTADPASPAVDRTMSGVPAGDTRHSTAARIAGLAFLPVPLIPLIAGIGTVIADPNRPGSGCFEYCAADRDGGFIALAVGVIGVWLALLIWRRHVAAMAVALFVTAVATILWAVGLVVPVGLPLLTQFSPNPMALVAFGVLAALVGIYVALVAALRVEMDRAGRRAAAQVPTTAISGERPA